MVVQEEKEEEIEIVHEKPKTVHVIDEFLYRTAVDKKSAVKLEDIELDLELYENKIQELINSNLLVQASKTKYFLDVEAYEHNKERENKKFALRLISIIIPGILFILLGVAWIIIAMN